MVFTVTKFFIILRIYKKHWSLRTLDTFGLIEEFIVLILIKLIYSFSWRGIENRLNVPIHDISIKYFYTIVCDLTIPKRPLFFLIHLPGILFGYQFVTELVRSVMKKQKNHKTYACFYENLTKKEWYIIIY